MDIYGDLNPANLNDTIVGTADPDSIYGGQGRDTIDGAGGGDSITGDLGDDTLYGGAGADTLYGGTPGVDVTTNPPLTGDYSALTNALVNGLGGTAGFGENALPPNDDNQYSYDLTGTFPGGVNIAGTTVNQITINNNGIITLGPLSMSIYNADLTSFGGVNTPSPGGNSTGSDTVYYDFDAATNTITVTWDDVAHYGQAYSPHAFQAQIVLRDGGDFDVFYRYEGLPDGETANTSITVNGQSFSLPQPTGANAGGLDAAAGDTGVAGLWAFEYRDGQLIGAPTHGDGFDLLYGGDGGDLLYGGSGSDSLHGDAGADTLDGGSGVDTLIGGAGADVLQGGAGHDSLTGGLGPDIFRFDGPVAGSDDVVSDFTTGTDAVALSKAGFGILSLADFDIVDAAAGPTEAKATLIVDTLNHTISWDADGTGVGAATLLGHGAFTTSAADYLVF